MTTDRSTSTAIPHADVPSVVRLEVDPVVTSVRFVRAVVRRALQAADVEVSTGLLTAVTEVFVNAVAEHERCVVADPIVVEVTTSEPLSVTVIDRGGGFDLEDQLRSDAGFADHGRGLLVATTFVPGLTVDRRNDRTRVRLPVVASS